MTREEIAAVMEKVPELSAFGIGYYLDIRKESPEVRDQWMAKERAELLDDVDGCTRAEEWLKTKEKRKTVNPDRTSYGLKHVAEPEIGYVTNGAFIVAAIHLGFPYRIERDSANPTIGITERSLPLTGKAD